MRIFSSFIIFLISIVSFSQNVKIDSTSFIINHGEISFYLDKDTSSFISVHKIKYSDILKLDGDRNDNWHTEKPFGPYNKKLYVHTGYDLGHLTPSNITSYNDSLNYHSFSMFNQAPQMSNFNQIRWRQLEKQVVDTIKKYQKDATIITGVLYNNNKTTCKYLPNSRIKIPIAYYKIVVLPKKTICYISNNDDKDKVNITTLSSILKLAKKNKNNLKITIK